MTRRRRPNSNRKMAEEAKKNVPPGYTLEEWMKKQEQDAITEVIEEKTGYMMNKVMEAIHAIEIKRRHKKHVIEEALNCAHALVELSFLRRDDGESPADADTWEPDEEPATVPIDTWAPGSVPVVEVPAEEVLRTMPASLLGEIGADMTESDGRTPATSPHIGSPATRRSGRTGGRKRRTSTSSAISGTGTFRSRSPVLSPQSIPTLQEEDHTHPHHTQAQVGVASSLSSTGRLRPKSSGVSTPLSESKKHQLRGAHKGRDASSAPARRTSIAQPPADPDVELGPPRPPPTAASRGSARARLRRHVPTAVPFEGNQQPVLPDIGQEPAPDSSGAKTQHRQQQGQQTTQQAQPVSTR